MRRAGPWPELAEGRVVHLVGRVTDQVFGFLGPATSALADSGVEQSVVLLDDLRFRHLLPRFHDSVELVLVPVARNPYRHWRELRKAFRDVLDAGVLKAVHLHGLLPCLVGASVARSSHAAAPLYFSPHGSKSLRPSMKKLGSALLWLLDTLFGGSAQRSIANIAAEARTLSGMTRQTVQLVESPVADAFFRARRNEARHPLIVTGNRIDNPRSAELFAQLAVLLGGETFRLSFNWIGTTDPGSMVRLKAANVGVFDVTNDHERATRLAAGWVYLAPGGTRGFPLFLVEAMAVGLPCVAIDTDTHRDVIKHGETGYLFRTETEVLHCIAELIDAQALRVRIGQAAREQAQQRFSEVRFRDSLFAAYGLPTPESTP